MYWENRRQYRYLYKTVRENGRAFRVYLGTGPAAEVLAAADHIDRQERQEQRAQLAELQQQVGAAVAPVRALHEETGILTRACLLGAGYREYQSNRWGKRHAEHTQAQ